MGEQDPVCVSGRGGCGTGISHVQSEPHVHKNSGVTGATARGRKCPGTCTAVVRTESSGYGADLHEDPVCPEAGGKTGCAGGYDGGEEGSHRAVGKTGDGRNPTGCEGSDEVEPASGSHPAGTVGNSVAARGPESDHARNGLPADHGDATVEPTEIGPFWTACGDKVCLLGPSVAEGVGSVSFGASSNEELPPGSHCTLDSARGRELFVAAGTLFRGDSNVDSAHALSRPQLGREAVCRSPSSSAGVKNPDGDVPKVDEIDCVELPPWNWTPEEVKILAGTDEEVPDVRPEAYYPFGTVVTQSGVKVREARKRTAAPLDTVTQNRLDYEQLKNLPAGDHEALSRALDWITTHKLWSYVSDDSTLTRISRHMGADVTTMVEWGLISPGTSRTYSHMFKVPKADKARLIVDCRPVNELLPSPEHMPLPNLHALLDELVDSSWIAQLDAKSYFYQFKLMGGAEEVFGVAIGDRRGSFTKFRLLVMPMGFKFAPTIAQVTSNFILENCGAGCRRAAWIDNFIFWGDKEDVTLTTDVFKKLCQRVKLELKPEEDAGEVVELLGLVVDTRDHSVALSEKNQARIREALEKLGKLQTPRTVYGVFGTVMWALYAVARHPLCQYEDFIRIIGRIAPQSRDGWDDVIQLKPEEWKSVQMAASEAMKCKWKRENHKTPTVALWTDASSRALGWVLELTRGDFCASQQVEGESIFLRELTAMVRGAQAASMIGRTITVLGDNTAAVTACRKGFSKNRKANVLLRRLYRMAPIWTAWVSTKVQRADALTRGEMIPGRQEPFTSTAYWPRWA